MAIETQICYGAGTMEPLRRSLASLCGLALRATVRLAVVGILCHARTAGAQTPQEFKAVGTEQVTAAIAAFKAAIGGSDNGSATGSQGSGYRQITWDDVPDALATPVFLPKDFYATSVPRGFLLGFSDNYHLFEVSAVEPNASGTPALFGNRSALFPTLFTTFSPGRIMRSAGTDNALYVDLKVPGSAEVASVSAFGAVFIDVDRENLSSLTFFDAEDHSLGTFFVPAASGTKTVSFLGVVFPPGAGRISRVRIEPGYVHVQQPLDEGDGRDLVALDDFIYAEPRRLDAPTIKITSPTTNATFAGGGPFLTLSAVSTNTMTVTWTDGRRTESLGRNPGEVEWRVTDFPLDLDVTVLTVTATGPNGDTARDWVTVFSKVFSYHLAEGSTGTFFDTDILIANPTAAPAPVTLTFLKEDGVRVLHTDTVAPMSRKTIHADEVPGLESAAFSTTVVSTSRVPLVVERAMFWDAARYDGNGAAAVAQASRTWYFAEGVQNDFFDTFVLLQNPTDVSANATLTFNRDFGEPPVLHHVSLPPLSRVTVDASVMPDLVGRSFGVKVEATEAIVAERSTYFESSPSRLWAGGHGSPGAPHLSTFWFFAEGATGDFRDTFLLLNNPGDAPTLVQLLFYTGSGKGLEFHRTVDARSRLTIPVESLQSDIGGAPLADAQFSVALFSGYPIVAERAMYWIGDPGPWADGTSTLGQTAPSKRWGFAEGRIGGPLGYHTYIRVANRHFRDPATVRITFLRSDGAPVVQTYTIPGFDFITVDVNAVPGLQDGDSVAAIVESTNGPDIFTERSMYWNSGGAFWAGGLATAGTRLP